MPKRGLELGLDEAGRGPILGPLVLACVVLTERATEELRRLGVADSKRFGAGASAHQARTELCRHIERWADHVGVATIEPVEIDARRGQLNHLEREHAERLIGTAPPVTRIWADGSRLFAPLQARFPHLTAEDKAESAHICVAAASVVAKVRRDELWLRILRRYQGEFGALLEGHAGGGYPNETTRRFLRAYCMRYRQLPPEARQSWPTEYLNDLLT